MRNQYRLRLAIATSLMLLAACAQPYRRPPPEASALLRLPPPISVIQYYNNGDDCSELTRLQGADSPFERADRTMTVPAGRRIAVNVLTTGPGISSCGVILSFVLSAGKRYEVQMTEAGGKCYARLLDMTGEAKPVPGVQQMRRNPIDSCRPM